jgi:hypothetical protein
MTKQALRWCFALLICLSAFAAFGNGMKPHSLLQAAFPRQAPVSDLAPAADPRQQQHRRPTRLHRDRSRELWRALYRD